MIYLGFSDSIHLLFKMSGTAVPSHCMSGTLGAVFNEAVMNQGKLITVQGAKQRCLALKLVIDYPLKVDCIVCSTTTLLSK